MNKKNLILGGILALLVAAGYIYQGPWQKWREEKNKPANFLGGLEVNLINKIEITKTGKTVVLEKADERWRIGGTKDFYAVKEEVESLLSDLKKAKTAEWELVSENKEKKSEFNTDQETGTFVRLFIGGTEAVNFIVGRFGNDFSSSYLSRQTDEKTYLAKVNLAGHFLKEEWRDRKIFTGNKEAINKIRFQYPDREFFIEKKDNRWEGIKPVKFTVSNEKIEPILTLMTSLTAVKIPEQNFAGTGLEKSKIIVQAIGEGFDHTIMIGNESRQEQGMFFAKRSDSDNIYLISREDRDKLDKKMIDLK